MDEQFRTSFIPKPPRTHRGGSKTSFGFYERKQSGSPLATISLFILILSLIALGVMHLLVWLADRDIVRMNEALEAKRQQFRPDQIQRYKRFDERLKLTEGVLGNHTVASEVFSLLSTVTLPTVRFTSFDFVEEFIEGTEIEVDGQLVRTEPTVRFSVSLEGEAGSFSDVVLQASGFKNHASIRESSFSDFRLDEGGRVTFSAELVLNPELIDYTSFVRRLPPERAEGDAAAPVESFFELRSAAGE